MTNAPAHKLQFRVHESREMNPKSFVLVSIAILTCYSHVASRFPQVNIASLSRHFSINFHSLLELFWHFLPKMAGKRKRFTLSALYWLIFPTLNSNYFSNDIHYKERWMTCKMSANKFWDWSLTGLHFRFILSGVLILHWKNLQNMQASISIKARTKDFSA